MHSCLLDTGLKVFLANGTANQIKYNEQTDVGSVISLITGRLSAEPSERPLQSLYALRLTLSADTFVLQNNFSSKQHIWLSRTSLISQSLEKLNLEPSCARFELRIRYFAHPLKEILHKDRVTFYYLYDQVCSKSSISTAFFIRITKF